MIALVCKDLRLAGDALRPIAVVVVGILLGSALLSLLPPKTLPVEVGFSAMEVASMLAQLVLFIAPIPAAWTTLAILHGDRDHQAACLSATLPIPSRWRRAGVAAAMCTSYACILLVAWGLATWPAAVETRLALLGVATLWWMLGVAAALVSSSAFANTFAGAAAAVIVAVLLAAVSFGGGFVGVQMVGGGVANGIDPYPALNGDLAGHMEVWQLAGVTRSATTTGALVGLGVAAAAMVTAAAIRSIRRGRRLARGSRLRWAVVVGVSGVVTSMGASVAGAGAFHFDARVQAVHAHWRIAREIGALSDTELLTRLEAAAGGYLDWTWAARQPDALGMCFREGTRRLATMSEAEWPDNELARGWVALATDARTWASRAEFRTALLYRSGPIAVDLAVTFAEGTLRHDPAAFERACLPLLMHLFWEERGIDQGSEWYNRLVEQPSRQDLVAAEFARFAGAGHRHAARLNELGFALRAAHRRSESAGREQGGTP